MPGNRMSALSVAQFCGRAGSLNSASGRPAVLGSSFHSVCGDQPDKKEWLFKLTAEEREEIDTWHAPTALEIKDWGLPSELGAPTCWYDTGQKEVTVCLNSRGEYCEEDDPDCISVGHLDVGWVVEGSNGTRLAVVEDIKSSIYTVDGPDILQLKAYGLAWAAKNNCTHYVTSIWGAREGIRKTGKVIDLFDAGDDWERVKHAAMNVDVDNPNFGSHCSKCYGWQRCDAFTMVASGVDGMADEEEIAEGNAAMLLAQADAAIKFGELTKKRLKLYAARTPIVSEDGNKAWGISMRKGKESVLSVAKLRKAMGEDAEQYITRGAEYDVHEWTNTDQGNAAAKKKTSDKAKAKRAAVKAAKEKA